jgi:hypothetical protein
MRKNPCKPYQVSPPLSKIPPFLIMIILYTTY